MVEGLISNIQRYSLKDGPGIRTTVFLKGCPLSCAWCHNPETLSRRPEIMMVETRCVRCGACVDACPNHHPVGAPESLLGPARGPGGAADENYGGVSCSLCGACVASCPTGARVMMGRTMSVDELMEEILADRIFFEDSGGGVTFSGGEPLLQFEFLRAMLIACHEHGLHTAVDTSGFARSDHLLTVAGLADLILFDVKLLDDSQHREFTGVSNERILENLRALAEVHGQIWLRVPFMPGLNDQSVHLEAVGKLAASLASVKQLNLLPYHKTGIHKFGRLGQKYRLTDLESPTPEQMNAAAERVASLGVKVCIGG